MPGFADADHTTTASYRHRTFTGREDLLEELAASLGAGTATAIMQAIAGLGDGRTSLAVEYVYRHQAAPQVEAMQGGVVPRQREVQRDPIARRRWTALWRHSAWRVRTTKIHRPSRVKHNVAKATWKSVSMVSPSRSADLPMLSRPPAIHSCTRHDRSPTCQS
jgi:hypothetical protein